VLLPLSVSYSSVRLALAEQTEAGQVTVSEASLAMVATARIQLQFYSNTTIVKLLQLLIQQQFTTDSKMLALCQCQ